MARGGLAAKNQRVGYLVAFDAANTDQTQVTAALETQREPRVSTDRLALAKFDVAFLACR